MSNNFEHINPNPGKNNRHDCVKRSLSLAYDIDYTSVVRELRQIRKDQKLYVTNVPQVFDVFIHRHGVVYESDLILKSKEITVREFLKEEPLGTFLLITGHERGKPKHMTCIKRGVILDTWNCSDSYIIKYYKVI